MYRNYELLQGFTDYKIEYEEKAPVFVGNME